MHRITIRDLLARLHVPAAALVVISASAANAADITGKWESNQGPMTITQEADGTYAVAFELIKGKVTGSLDGDVLKGIWIRAASDETCKIKKDGSPYWGGFKVTFYPSAGFQGYMSWCSEEIVSGMPVENWTGARSK